MKTIFVDIDKFVVVECKRRKSPIKKGIKVFPFEFKLKGAFCRLQASPEFQNNMPLTQEIENQRPGATTPLQA